MYGPSRLLLALLISIIVHVTGVCASTPPSASSTTLTSGSSSSSTTLSGSGSDIWGFATPSACYNGRRELFSSDIPGSLLSYTCASGSTCVTSAGTCAPVSTNSAGSTATVTASSSVVSGGTSAARTGGAAASQTANAAGSGNTARLREVTFGGIIFGMVSFLWMS